MKNNKKIISMKRLRKEKRKLELQISGEKVELIAEVEKYKNSLWPFKALNNVKKTMDTLSENKLVALGAQLAYSALNAAKESKEKKETEETGEEEHNMKSNVVEFLKKTAKSFLENYVKKDDDVKE
jgi:hypothetical protein